MNARLRLTTALLVTLATVSLAPAAPALAQGGPSAAQYQGGGSGHCPSNSLCVSGLNDGADAFSENAGQGTAAVNEALEEPVASGEASSAPAGSVQSAASATAEPSSTEGGTTEEGGPEGSGKGGPEGPGTITELPETGGASLAALGSGVLLMLLGLMARRLAWRP